MIIFLYGQDTYQLNLKLKAVIENYRKIHPKGLNLRYLDFKKDNYNNLYDEIQSISMFAKKKLLVLKNTFLNEDFKANFLRDSQKFLDSKEIILFYEENKIQEKDKLFQFLRKYGEYQEIQPLEGEKLKGWAKKEFEKHETEIESPALERLINFAGNDLWRLSKEIEKLITYKKKEIIRIKDIELLVKPKIETAIFETIDAIAARDKKRALNLIHQHLEKGDSPAYLLSMINFQFRNLLMIKSNKSGERLGMHPFVVQKTLSQAKRFSLEELKKIYQKIFQADLNIKTGKIEAETALDLLITEI